MNHYFNTCETNFNSLGILNSFISLSIYMLSVILNYLPAPENLIAGALLAIITSLVSFLSTKGYGLLYNYFFCRNKVKKVTKIEILEIQDEKGDTL